MELLKLNISIIFKDYNISIFQAKDGLQGVEYTFEHGPDIIYTDVMMPRMNGLSLVKAVRKSFGNNIPIVIVSAIGNHINLAEHTPNTYCVSKPIEHEDLKKVTTTILNNWDEVGLYKTGSTEDESRGGARY